MKSKNDYRQLIQIIRTVIHEWDPYKLLAAGAPEDEFDDEIAKVVARVKDMRTERDAIEIISHIFQKAFGENFGFKDCEEVGKKMFTLLKASGFIKK